MQATTKPTWNSRRPALRDIDWESGPDRLLCHNTHRITITDEDEQACSAVMFHRTVIVESLGNGIYRLNSGGYRTSTTKQRLNALLYGFGVSIYQRNFEWFVSTPNGELLFEDNMKVIAKGWQGCY